MGMKRGGEEEGEPGARRRRGQPAPKQTRYRCTLHSTSYVRGAKPSALEPASHNTKSRKEIDTKSRKEIGTKQGDVVWHIHLMI